MTFFQSGGVETITYGIGRVVGYVVEDQVAWVRSPMPSQVSDGVRFLLIYTADNLNTLQQDGLVGLSPGSVNSEQKTLLQEMVD